MAKVYNIPIVCVLLSAIAAWIFGHIELEVTYDDPGTFTEPVQALIKMEYRADSELLESVCNEIFKRTYSLER